ncbi:hypothetical protein ACFLIM_36415 [Nonomuraea sp. M3C6]|uniref:Uncharacterized protein n=1 Tax=Nonomuraea marmarensis TaxID=3351344 RepID=A0ABW7AMS6_9ACTN
MSWAWARIGCRAAIMTMDHSPPSTRAYRSLLIGREGVVVAVLRNDNLALLKLDDSYYLPAGARRWAVAWDDLDVGEPARVSDVADPMYVAGFTKGDGKVEQHAVLSGTEAAVCSSPVGPLPFCGWSLPFSPNAAHACPNCVTLVDGS